MSVSQTKYLKDFLHNIGDTAVFNLNTICIGLHFLEEKESIDSNDGLELHITYKTDDVKNASRKARKFVERAFLIFVYEAFYVYILKMSKGYFPTRIKRMFKDKNLSGADKVENLLSSLELQNPSYLPIMKLVCQLRNNIVHGNNVKLTDKEIDLLRTHKDWLHDNHAGIDIIETYEHCKYEKSDPKQVMLTLKDVSTFISIVIRLAKAIDKEFSLIKDTEKFFEIITSDKMLKDDFNKTLKQPINERSKYINKFCKVNMISVSESIVKEIVELDKNQFLELLAIK